MQDFLTSIATGVIANALTSTLRGASTTPSIRHKLTGDAQLGALLGKAAAGLGKAKSQDSLKRFLVSPDAEVVLRHVFAVVLTESGHRGEHPNSARPSHRQSIEEEFIANLRATTRLPLAPAMASQLFGDLLKACDRALAVAVGDNLLSAHDARENLRFRLVLDELATVSARLDWMAKRQPDLPAIAAFEAEYRQAIAHRHRSITPPQSRSIRSASFKDLYVLPRFSDQKGAESIDFEGLLARIHRTVVLGDPGAGKSTLTSYLCHLLSTRYDDRLLAARSFTPILILLRDYASAYESDRVAFTEFVESQATSHHQLQPPPNTFEHLIASGRCLVIFDGLDELLDTTRRNVVSANIESFCRSYPAAPVIVTSRKVGYQEAPLDRTTFEVLDLVPFNASDVRQYALAWFATDDTLSVTDARDRATKFLEETERLDDIRRNALMLALMCGLYRDLNYIPRNRTDIYERCTNQLFEERDRGKHIYVPHSFEAHIRPAVMDIAAWLFQTPALQKGVAESTLITRVATYLSERQFGDIDLGIRSAREFVEFCKGRAWIFTDVGTTADGEPLYQFTHRTFMEYFAAWHLVRAAGTPEQLCDVLVTHIAKSEWDMVAQLAFQIQSRNIDGAADVLCERILESAAPDDWVSRSFLARALAFMAPSPRFVSAFARTAAEAILASWEEHWVHRGGYGTDWMNVTSETFVSLLGVARENRTVTIRSVTDSISAALRVSELRRLCALDFVFSLPAIAGRYGVKFANDWRQALQQVVSEGAQQLRGEGGSDGGASLEGTVRRLLLEYARTHSIGLDGSS